MLDWYFIIMLLLAILFLILSVEYEGHNNFWNFTFLILSTVMWFILAQLNLDIQTAYSGFNSTSGNMEMHYDLYSNEATIYISYIFMLMGILCIIYMLVLIFGSYYDKLDRKEKKTWENTED